MQMTMWEYDFHQFRENAENISESEVRETPGNFSDYKPVSRLSVEEQIAQIQLNSDMTIAELSILIAQLMQ